MKRDEEDIVSVLDCERDRQGLTKEQLADMCGMSGASMRRLLTSKGGDVKLSTLRKISVALGASIEIKKVDFDLDEENGRLLIERVRRTRLSERLGEQTGLDPGDIEHALYNLTLTPSKRLERRLRSGRLILEQR